MMNTNSGRWITVLHRAVLLLALADGLLANRRASAQSSDMPVLQVPERWEYTAPLIEPENRQHSRSHAQKDPSVVFHDGKWHVFMTIKTGKRTVMEYCAFADWDEANSAPRHLLTLCDRDYFCAPQVFYFEPHRKWYLIYQVGNPGSRFMAVAYSTTTTISDPSSWSQADYALDGGPNDPRKEGGLDYWIICDDTRAWLFWTTNNGKMWRMWTELERFPNGFRSCELALQGPIFEASHTYRLAGQQKYLTLIEADGQRFYRAYLADRLDGEWTEITTSSGLPFASQKTIHPARGVQPWTDQVSHGELVRLTNDQTLTVDPNNLTFLFQGMLEQEKAGKSYSQYSWRLGLLRSVQDRGTSLNTK